ncbi:MAG: YeeE/YedE family protein [Nannocystaceae bacterium]
MADFSPLAGLAGGALVGLAAALFLHLNGRIAGISSLIGNSVTGTLAGSNMAFLAGMLTGGVALSIVLPGNLGPAATDSWTVLLVGGFLVGFGTRMGNGCTSGHGVCGLARLSPRSLAGTCCFIGSGAVTVLAIRMLGGENLP